ncbi:hypothetical protein [[Kitasatospora] papulosa]|uniref:hypothetical protein n=1 Tax=[Kitasatospora] papulosa TaxID=1464011 RepID=UPI0036E9C82B
MAQSLAHSMVMMLEGTFRLSRAARDPEPLRVAGRSITLCTLCRSPSGTTSSGSHSTGCVGRARTTAAEQNAVQPPSRCARWSRSARCSTRPSKPGRGT